MKKFSLYLLIIICFQLSAQNINTSSTGGLDSRVTEAFTRMRNKIGVNKVSSQKISGSPYFNEEFQKSSIVYFDKKLKEQVFLRYNAFSDEIEMKENKTSHSDQALLKNSKIHCAINGVTYKYLPIPQGDQRFEKAGYIKEVYKGDVFDLYLRQRKIYREGKKARTSLEQSFPPRFVDFSAWFYQTKSSGLKRFKPNKKEIKKIFKSKSSILAVYLKENKIDFKNETELKNLFSYLDRN